MTPGLTRSLLSHKPPGCLITQETVDDWGRTILLLWTIIGLITGGALLEGIGKADLVTSSVVSDGSVMSTSAYLSDDKTIIGRIFGSGRTIIDRETETDDTSFSRLQVQSDGPLLIGEYASAEQKKKDRPITCVFGNTTETPVTSEIETSGILQHGTYSRMHTLQPFESIVIANGTGILDLRHRITGNETITGRTVATGNLSVSEHITRVQGESP